jgi:hypothetical protein
MDINDFRKRVRRHGLLRALAEGPGAARPPQPAVPAPPPPPPPVAPPPGEADAQDTVEFELDPQIAERLAACTLSCPAVVTALADLPAVEHGGEAIEVALLRMRVRRPEGDAEVCVRQHVPAEIRGVIEPGSGVMVHAHATDRSVAVVDWAATGDWIGVHLTAPTAPEQYDWPPVQDWPQTGEIEVHDVNGLRERLAERRGAWALASAGLVSLTPLRSRVDQRDQWRVVLMMRDGSTVQLTDRLPALALARLASEHEPRIGTPIDVLVSSEGEVAVDWEATLRQPELRSPRR